MYINDFNPAVGIYKYKIPYLKWVKETKAQIKRTCCPQNLIYSLQWELFFFKHLFRHHSSYISSLRSKR